MGVGFWIGIVTAIILLFAVIPFLIIGFLMYAALLMRVHKGRWGRECVMPGDAEYKKMYDDGLLWGERYADKMSEVRVKNGRYGLAGQYFDFGFDKAVIIIAGRTEGCLYSYYFAEPYRQSGYNVLVIDNRAHGYSDGRINSLGYKEYEDLLVWGRLLHDTYNNKSVVLHGICIGSSAALFALASDKCPDYMSGMVAEGMYVNFYDSFKNHILERKKPLFPMLHLVTAYIRIVSGADIVNDGPLARMPGMKKPILFIQSRQDIYSLPEKAQLLYDACGSENKRLVYFDRGAHSRVRINDPTGYDKAVTEFLQTL